MKCRRWFLSACVLVLGLSGCVGAPRADAPLNLSRAKAAVVAYYDRGDYERDLAAVAARADAWLVERAARRAPDERLAVVFDIDETVLSNYLHMLSQDFGYVPEVWEAWVDRGDAPAVVPVRQVYQTARRLGLDVIFLTGRVEPRDRPGTELNLQREGMGDYTRLILAAPDAARSTAALRKAAARRALEDEGFTVIASIGDQESDLVGGSTERTFKLPNPFYLVP